MNERLRRILISRWLPAALAVLAVALAAPALRTGWQQDDLIHRYFLLGNPDATGQRPTSLDLFAFLTGDSARAYSLMNAGVVPWWTLPDLRLSFLRPLASLTHWLDYQLWPQSAVLMHLQSLFWFGAAVVAAGTLYRRLMGMSWVAGLAALLFALDDVHGLPAGWLANRNALLSLLFGILAIVAHDRWRHDRWRPGAVAGPLLLLLALLSGESGLAVAAYLVAYAAVLDRGNPAQRIRSLVPHAIIVLAWLTVYAGLGYGTRGSGFYANLGEPVEFIRALLWNGPVLLADQWGVPPSSFVVFLDQPSIALLWVWSTLCVALIGWMLLPLLRRDRLARFWFAGMLLALPLACLTVPHSRLLTVVGIGALGLLAQWGGGVLVHADWVPGRRAWLVTGRVILVFFALVHLVLAPILLPLNATSAAFAERYIQEPAREFDAGPELERQRLIVVNHPLVFYAHHFPTVRALDGALVPRSFRVLAPGDMAVVVRRADEFTLEVSPEGGYLRSPFDRLFRDVDHALETGAVVELEGMTATILRVTGEGRPASVGFRFRVPLDDASIRWVQWENGAYRAFVPPPPGDSLTLPAGPVEVFRP